MARRGILVIIGTLLLQDIPFRYGSFLVSEKRLMRDNCSRIWTVILTQGIPFFGLVSCQAFFVGPQPIGKARITPKRSEDRALCHRCDRYPSRTVGREPERDYEPGD